MIQNFDNFQMTFDGAVNLNVFQKYDTLLKLNHGKRSKCPLRGTFFVKHDYNNYNMIEQLYYRGNEIAVNSVTGRNLQYENATIWKEELEGMRDLLGELANVPAKDILGVRAESLKPGFNEQFQVSKPFTLSQRRRSSNRSSLWTSYHFQGERVA